jgi:selenophosphate synthase
VHPDLPILLLDPQTSGGLLAAVPPQQIAALEAECARRHQPLWRIGTVRVGRGIFVY